MQSVSKTHISQETAQELVRSSLGAGAQLRSFEELTDGFFNAAYALGLDDGRRMVLKIAPPQDVRILRYERQIIHTEVQVMRLVRQRTSVPVPEIYAFDASCSVVGSPFFLMEFVPGQPFHKLRGALPDGREGAIEREIGGYLRQINAINGPAFGLVAPGGVRADTWPAAFAALFEDVLCDGEAIGVELPLGYAGLRQLLERLRPALAGVREPRLLHWDLWDGNVFVDPASGQITGLIDFERALWGDPLMEFQFRPYEVPATFAAGYGAQLIDSDDARVRRALYNIYLYLILIIECYYRRYETDDQERWARAELAAELARLNG